MIFRGVAPFLPACPKQLPRGTECNQPMFCIDRTKQMYECIDGHILKLKLK